MNLRSGLVILVIVLITIFSALNWSVLMAPTELSLGFTTANAPLGLIMLGLIVALAAVFLIYIVVLQAGMMSESRRVAKELKAQRELADKAEASRFDELRQLHSTDMDKLIARIDQLDRELRSAIEANANGLSAALGEIDDRLQRTGTPRLMG
ncbi:LapA family protein [Thiomonas arsenitoxydans]|uniref:LapA family protein n=1 Tax=Thiomonas arsenitoxydans (strain DSM 22701 / CIP 110005 / 3As) TaxID=426114 RepID=UPI001AC95636|nr:LapA family protein [Thiomonas arsenitoxydans]MBN8776256.1 LapA family protein [Thiomonas arsenitoxydans]